MSLNDDLLRNRKIFDMLTGSDSDGENSVETASIPSKPFSPPVSEAAHTPAPLKTSDFAESAMQRPLTFSLENGKALSRDIGMALQPSHTEIKAVEFPPLGTAASDNTPAKPADTLESLYRRLAIDARRSSQLLGEEDF